jgi:hypothetical protein
LPGPVRIGEKVLLGEPVVVRKSAKAGRVEVGFAVTHGLVGKDGAKREVTAYHQIGIDAERRGEVGDAAEGGDGVSC